MKTPAISGGWDRLNRLRKQRNVRNMGTLGLVLMGPVLALATFAALNLFEQGAASQSLRIILLTDLVYVLMVAALVLQRVARMIAARRAQSAGSRLHLRLTGVFAFIALLPTILVAVFATATLNFGLEGWFSDRVRQVVGTSLEAAQAYEAEHRDALTRDAEGLARLLNDAKRRQPLMSEGLLREVLSEGQGQIQRGLREAYVVDMSGAILVRGVKSYLFDFERPTEAEIDRARGGETVLIADWDNDEFRALISLRTFGDRLLYVSRAVDGSLLNLLDETKATINLYQQLESERGRLLFEFGLIYLGFAMIVILAAIWLGLWFAERLSRPVGRLAGAVQRVGAGDLTVRVQEEEGDDEITMLSRVFNQMTRQLQAQRDSLVESNRQIEIRRRLFDSVLSGVTTGVIGLSPKGTIELLNAAASRLLTLDRDGVDGMQLVEAVPEFSYLFNELTEGNEQVAQEEVQLTRAGTGENLLVRIAARRTAEGRLEGYVVTFDDVTDLISAQRMAAWGDVARRIAHEIKNPLTPIQLSAERIKRKFRDVPGVEMEAVEQYTDVIIRQTNDLRRIVDEFSKFARMPEPERRLTDLVDIVRDAVLLQENAQPGIRFDYDRTARSLWGYIDQTMISQALINLLKNACEAIESRQEATEKDFQPEIRLVITEGEKDAEITISDNGIGLPENRARLFEPYVTNREKGTGLGLSIVKKIIEEHGGTLDLLDAAPFADGARPGAMARIRLPGLSPEKPKDLKRNIT